MGSLGRSTDLHVGSADPTSSSIRRGSLSFVLDGGLEHSGVGFVSNGPDLVEIISPTWSVFWINPPAFTKSPKLMEILSLNHYIYVGD